MCDFLHDHIEQEARMPRISVGQAELADRPHILYRFFDRTGVLLYVGITVDFATRMATHAKEKDWWPRVDRSATRIAYLDSRRAALDAEREVIQAEMPLHNDQHNRFISIDRPKLWTQREVAQLILDEVVGVLSRDEERIKQGALFGVEQAALPEDERMYDGSMGQSLVAALHVVEVLARDVRRFRRVAQMLLEAIPLEMRWAVLEEADSDYRNADEEDAPWEERAPDQLRHLSCALARAFGQPRPTFRRLVSVS